MKSIRQAIAAYTRPAPIVRVRPKSVAVQQLQAEKPQGWHRLVNRVLAAR